MGNLGVEGTVWKILELYDQNPWRNNLPKLATFDPNLQRPHSALVTFVWLFSTVRFQMCPQIACPRKCIIALAAFVCLFSIVYFQMSPQITCWRGCKVTLVAFFWLFSTLGFQMCPQIACPRECIVALAAFVLTFLRCVFSNESSNDLPRIIQTSPQVKRLRKGILTNSCIYIAFLHCTIG